MIYYLPGATQTRFICLIFEFEQPIHNDMIYTMINFKEYSYHYHYHSTNCHYTLLKITVWKLQSGEKNEKEKIQRKDQYLLYFYEFYV